MVCLFSFHSISNRVVEQSLLVTQTLPMAFQWNDSISNRTDNSQFGKQLEIREVGSKERDPVVTKIAERERVQKTQREGRRDRARGVIIMGESEGYLEIVRAIGQDTKGRGVGGMAKERQSEEDKD